MIKMRHEGEVTKPSQQTISRSQLFWVLAGFVPHTLLPSAAWGDMYILFVLQNPWHAEVSQNEIGLLVWNGMTITRSKVNYIKEKLKSDFKKKSKVENFMWCVL